MCFLTSNVYSTRLELLGRLRPLGAGRRARDLVLDAALVLAADDAEEALLAPVGVPRVGDLPVLGAVLDAPSDDLDGVAARRLARRALVDAAGVVLEIAIDLRRSSSTGDAGTTLRRWRVAVDFRAAPTVNAVSTGPPSMIMRWIFSSPEAVSVVPWNLYLSALKSAWEPLAVLSHFVGPGGDLSDLQPSAPSSG